MQTSNPSIYSRGLPHAVRVCGWLLLASMLCACGSAEPSANAQPAPAAAATDGVVVADGSVERTNALGRSLSTAIQVRVATAEPSALDAQTNATGNVMAFRKAIVSAEVSGRVVVRAVEPGDPVETGQTLVSLDNERARIAQAEARAQLSAREVDQAQARSEYQRGIDLHARKFISDDALDSLRFAEQRATSQLAAARAAVAAANRTVADTTIRAPFTGTAERVHVQQGDFLAPGTPVVTLTDFTKARVRTGVTAREATLLARSETADITLEALGPDKIRGAIRSISRVADPATGTYTVEIWVDGALGPIREGMIATVHIPYAKDQQHLAVPVAAVFRRAGVMHVFAVENSTARLQIVRTGRTDGTLIEIESGLTAGDVVVVDGQFALRDGANVRIENG